MKTLALLTLDISFVYNENLTAVTQTIYFIYDENLRTSTLYRANFHSLVCVKSSTIRSLMTPIPMPLHGVSCLFRW